MVDIAWLFLTLLFFMGGCGVWVGIGLMFSTHLNRVNKNGDDEVDLPIILFWPFAGAIYLLGVLSGVRKKREKKDDD